MNLNSREKTKYVIKSSLIAVIIFTVINIGFLTRAHAAVSASDLINLANVSRTQNNLGLLTTNDELTQAALAKANDMFAHQYFAHTSPDGKTPWDFIKAINYEYNYAGENLAIGYSDNNELHNAWMNSPSHRENILNPNYRDIGMASVSGVYQGSQTIIVVQEFGSTNNDQPLTAVASANQNPGFTIDSSKTSFSPQKSYAGEEVLFKTSITGNVSDVYFIVGDTKIDLKNEKNYEKSVKINTSGSLTVNLVVVDLSGEKHTQTIGTLQVLPTTISKDYIGSNNFVSHNYISIISILLFALIVAGYFLMRHQKKYQEKLFDFI